MISFALLWIKSARRRRKSGVGSRPKSSARCARRQVRVPSRRIHLNWRPVAPMRPGVFELYERLRDRASIPGVRARTAAAGQSAPAARLRYRRVQAQAATFRRPPRRLLRDDQSRLHAGPQQSRWRRCSDLIRLTTSISTRRPYRVSDRSGAAVGSERRRTPLRAPFGFVPPRDRTKPSGRRPIKEYRYDPDTSTTEARAFRPPHRRARPARRHPRSLSGAAEAAGADGMPPVRCRLPHGRWQWAPKPEGAHEASVRHAAASTSICRPGSSPSAPVWRRSTRTEIIALARHTEAAEKAEHPMNRVAAIEQTDKGLVITTTDIHLPRRICNAVKDAHRAKLNSSSRRRPTSSAPLSI